MGKMKKSGRSVRLSFMIYLPITAVIAFAGVFGIGVGTNYLQDWYYESRGLDRPTVNSPVYTITVGTDGVLHYEFIDNRTVKERFGYNIISGSQFVLMPLWCVLCLLTAGKIFYDLELKKPIDALSAAAKKIGENDLDFTVDSSCRNELGQLCRSFEEMRSALYKNNMELWRASEERKRLNSAFSHDLRTPLTVLRGYTEMLEKYLPDGKLSEEKTSEILKMMSGQITRLERYTQQMSSVQKLEDIVPEPKEISLRELGDSLFKTGTLVCGDKELRFDFPREQDGESVAADTGLIMRVFENLLSNAVRYAEAVVEVSVTLTESSLSVTVSDDGKGFSPEALRSAAEPFFRGEKEEDKEHFGLGLYICKVLCEKCGGRLTAENGAHGGGQVTASFGVTALSNNDNSL